MMIVSPRWRSWSVWVVVVALIAGCGVDEKGAERPPGQPHDDGTATRSSKEGKMQPTRELPQLPVEPQDWPRIFTEGINAGDLGVGGGLVPSADLGIAE